MLLIALYLIHLMGFPEVVIMTSTPLLSDQMMREIREFTSNENITFCHAEDLHDLPKARCYLIDEADQCLENFITFDDKSRMDGFFDIVKKTEMTLYFSATMPQFYERLLTSCYATRDTKPIKTEQIESRYQISSDEGHHFAITDLLFGNQEDLKSQFLIGLTDKSKPVMIFVEKDDPTLIKWISDQCHSFYSKPPTVIMKQSELKEGSDSISSQTTGACILHMQFGRGVNLRYLCDCTCLIIANGLLLNWDQVKQIAGRSSRRFGQCVATVYIQVNAVVSDMERGGKKILESRKTDWAQDEGITIATALYKKFNILKIEKLRQQVANAFPDPTSWRVKVSSLKALHLKIHNFIKSDDGNPTGNDSSQKFP